MSNPILAAYLKDFAKNFDLQSLKPSSLFEYFSSYCVYHRDFSEHTSLDEVAVAGGGDTAIDSFAVYLNDIFVSSSSQVDEIISRSRIDIDFVFVQAKQTRSLSASEVGNYIQGVKEFFGQKYMPANDDILRKRELSDHIYTKSVQMKSKPKLNLYYCYTGSFLADANIVARVDAGKDDLRSLNLFSEISFTFLDSDSLQSRYQEVNLRVEKEIVLSEYAPLPPISGIRQSYIGIVRCKELINLLSNSDGKLQKSLFNENVRDFLGRNPVNDDIAETIKSPEKQSRLAALNNGITIVAREIKLIGKKFIISDFQIVNGCQTSHVIFEHRDYLTDGVSINMKIIEVEDRELVNDIVRATNRQTEVKDEAFEVLSDFHKKLERFFESVEGNFEQKLVYERRKRQYSDSAYTSKNIVSLSFITNSFISCVMQNPVDAVDYYGILLKRYSNKIFQPNHSMWTYVAAAALLREIEKMCVGKIRENIWKWRFVLAALVWKEFGPLPSLSDDKSQMARAVTLISACRSIEKFTDLLRDAEIKVAEEMNRQGDSFDRRNAHQDRRFIEKLLA